MVSTVAVIPARYASTRFPGKPLAKETGKFLIQHVYERVVQAKRIDRVIVATDDERIVSAVESFGGSVCMTRTDHPSGTDRVAEVTDALAMAPGDIVLNVQGDEPELAPEMLDELVAALVGASGGENHACGIATLAAPFSDGGPIQGAGSPVDPNCVKVVVGTDGHAMYFSRSLIPYPRDTGGVVDRPSRWLLHLGVYAFRVETLHRALATGTPRAAEAAESLEQLRWLAHGFAIRVIRVSHTNVGIDTPEDYAAFVRRRLSPA